MHWRIKLAAAVLLVLFIPPLVYVVVMLIDGNRSDSVISALALVGICLLLIRYLVW